MENQDQNMERLKERFNLKNNEFALLNEIKYCVIVSIPSTIEGGFVENTGKFNPS